uniref:2-methoxy-6-polyprenyl-1,4-benzoquinol methylase, mitochondrial n=1 Tax=Arcella intermedia TaxID=1963864 RepID=A0A6B2LC22_9EUKA
MNDMMSMGVHRLWKDYFIQKLNPLPGTQLLDVAGGTGDIAFRFMHHVKNSPFYAAHRAQSGLPSKVTVIDINPSMLAVGQERAIKQGYFPSGEGDPAIEFKLGNAEALPIPDCSVDAYTIAFGIRNCTNVDKVLCEAFRVLKPGGRFLCLEFSRVENTLFSFVYDSYSFWVIPKLGEVIAQDKDSYQYLVESIRKFPDQPKFASMIREAGFELVEYDNLLNGISAIHSGFKPLRITNKT